MAAGFSKHDRVEFEHKNSTLYGVVTRGGSKSCVVIVDGGKYEYTVPVPALKISSKPILRDDAHPMDAWTLKSYRESSGLSEETVAFTATVVKNGRPVLSAKNDGRGGCNTYYPIEGGYASVTQFNEEAKQWLMDHGMPEEDCFEAGDIWLSWKASQAPYGVTAAAMVADWMESLGKAPNPMTSSEGAASRPVR